MTLAEAEAIFAQPKRRGRRRGRRSPSSARTPTRARRSGCSTVASGPYVTDGTTNASVPRGVDPEDLDLEQAVDLLREREARRPGEEEGGDEEEGAGQEVDGQEVDGQERPRRRPPRGRRPGWVADRRRGPDRPDPGSRLMRR